MNKLGFGGSPGSGSFLFADPASEDAALSEATRGGDTAPSPHSGSAESPLT